MPRPVKKPAAKPKRSAAARFGDWLVHTVGGALTSGGAIVALMVGLWALDDRYAHAADINRQVEINRLTAETAILQIRRGTLEDKVYDTAARQSQTKRPLPPAEKAIFDRYQAELNSISAEITAKQRQLERVKTGR